MTPFEFLAMAISVIMGLAITNLVSGIGITIRQIKSKNNYWVHSLWIYNILIYLSGVWWALFKWSAKEDWGFSNFLFLIIYATFIYLLTDFLVPRKMNSVINLKKHFKDNRKMFFGILFLSIIMDIIETNMLELAGLRILPPYFTIIMVSFSILALLGFLTKNKIVNYTVVIIWALGLTYYVFNSLFILQ